MAVGMLYHYLNYFDSLEEVVAYGVDKFPSVVVAVGVVEVTFDYESPDQMGTMTHRDTDAAGVAVRVVVERPCEDEVVDGVASHSEEEAVNC